MTNRKKLAAIAAALVLISCQPAFAGVVAHYRFEDSSNLGLDTTGNHDGTLVNGPTASSLVGQDPVNVSDLANAGSLNVDFTSPAYISVADSSALDFGNNPWTIEAYLNLDTLPTTSTVGQYIVQKKDAFVSDNFTDYAFLLSGNRANAPSGYFDNGSYVGTGRNLQVEFGNGATGQIFRSVLSVPTTGWAFVSAAYDGANTVRFTLDTDLTDNLVGLTETIVGVNIAPTVNAGSLLIGAKKNGAGGYAQGFDGLIDEVRISDTFLPTSSLQSVPEASSLVMAGLGVIGGLAALVKRRTK